MAQALRKQTGSVLSALEPRSVVLKSGLRLEYVEQGKKTGTPVVFLHGYTDSLHSWDLVPPHLPQSVHAFAITQRGHGDSDHPLGGYEICDFAEDVVGFMDELGIKAAVLVGHSMGTMVSQRIALEHPERVKALVLIGAFTNMAANPGIQEFWSTQVSKLGDVIDPEFARAFQMDSMAQPVLDDFVELVLAECLKAPARLWREAFKGFVDFDVSDELHCIKAPALVLWGGKETFSPRQDQEALVKHAKAELKIYASAGHCPNWEEPERVAKDIETFIAKLTCRD